MRFGAQDNGIMRFGAQDNGIMRLAPDYENVCGDLYYPFIRCGFSSSPTV
jgi:hypothetical protein